MDGQGEGEDDVVALDVGAASRRAGCPKRMVFGPCGGVRSGGRCEVDDRPCPFVVDPAPRWSTTGTNDVGAPLDLADRSAAMPALEAPIVVCDVRPAEATLAAARSLAHLHAGWCDAVLLGEHHDRVDLPNVVLAPTLLAEGCRPWVTLSCRDRNGVALEADLVALAELGVTEVHCVTGDARAAHVRPGTTPVFDLDSLRLTALARKLGLTVSVAESPTVEPVDRRPRRAADKARAGATWSFVNLGVTPAEVDTFIRRSRAAGSTLRHIVCVPVFTDAAGADRLAALPGVDLDPVVVDAVVHGPDPRAAGIAHAVAAARAFLDVEGVDGVDLSGPASSAGPEDRAAVMRAVAEQLRAPASTSTQRTPTPTPAQTSTPSSSAPAQTSSPAQTSTPSTSAPARVQASAPAPTRCSSVPSGSTSSATTPSLAPSTSRAGSSERG